MRPPKMGYIKYILVNLNKLICCKYNFNANNADVVCPIVNLANNVVITGGSGFSSSPFTNKQINLESLYTFFFLYFLFDIILIDGGINYV